MLFFLRTQKSTRDWENWGKILFSVAFLVYSCFIAGTFVYADNIVHDSSSEGAKFAAFRFIDKGHYKRAIPKLEGLLRVALSEPERQEIHHVLGYCYEKLGHRAKAIGSYARVASHTYPLADSAIYRLAKIYEKMNNKSKARAWYSRIVKEYPDSFYRAQAQWALVELHLKQKQWAAAKAFLSELSDDKRYVRKAAYARGQCEEGLRNTAAAFEIYRQLLQENYTDNIAEESLGRFKRLSRNHKRLTLTAEDRLNCGRVFLNRKNWKAAALEFERITSTKDLKLRGQAFYFLGQNYQGRKWYNTAIKKYNVVVALGHQSDYLTRAEYQTAQCYRLKGHLKTATKRFESFVKAYEWSELVDDALYALAQIQEKRGNVAAAFKAYTQLIQVAPKSPYADVAGWRIGWQRFDEKRYKESYNAFKGLKENFPGNRYAMGAHFWMAKIRERQNRPALAQELYTQVAKANYWYYSARAKAILGLSRSELEPRAIPDAELPAQAALPKQANALMKLHLYEDAIAQLSYQIEYGELQTAFDTFYALINCYEQTARYDRAREVAEQALQNQTFVHTDTSQTRKLREVLYPRYYASLIGKYAVSYQVDEYLIYAMILEESRYRADAISWAGAIGLMQIMPATGKLLARQLKIRRFRTTMLKQPEINIQMGTKYIAYLNSLFDNNAMLVTGAYNGGPGRMRRWIKSKNIADLDEFVEKIKIRETRLHIKKVINSYDNYVEIYGQREAPAVNSTKEGKRIGQQKQLTGSVIGKVSE